MKTNPLFAQIDFDGASCSKWNEQNSETSIQLYEAEHAELRNLLNDFTLNDEEESVTMHKRTIG